jgi:hypothetical protein
VSAAACLNDLIESLSRCLDAESARRVVELRVAPAIQERIDGLAEAANEGTLSDDESAEYEALINAADFISTSSLKPGSICIRTSSSQWRGGLGQLSHSPMRRD